MQYEGNSSVSKPDCCRCAEGAQGAHGAQGPHYVLCDQQPQGRRLWYMSTILFKYTAGDFELSGEPQKTQFDNYWRKRLQQCSEYLAEVQRVAHRIRTDVHQVSQVWGTSLGSQRCMEECSLLIQFSAQTKQWLRQMILISRGTKETLVLIFVWDRPLFSEEGLKQAEWPRLWWYSCSWIQLLHVTRFALGTRWRVSKITFDNLITILDIFYHPLLETSSLSLYLDGLDHFGIFFWGNFRLGRYL